MAGVGLIRLQKELKMLAEEPPPGVCAWPVGDCLNHWQAQIQGPEDTPYERGTFLLDLQIPDRYPFEPPKVRFVTPIYHPNIDSGGRICLDTLKMRPAGSWAPSTNVPTLLTTIRLLMAHPNGDDGLMPDITELFLKNPSRFADVARAHVEKHARQDPSRTNKMANILPSPPTAAATATSASARSQQDASTEPISSGKRKTANERGEEHDIGVSSSSGEQTETPGNAVGEGVVANRQPCSVRPEEENGERGKDDAGETLRTTKDNSAGRGAGAGDGDTTEVTDDIGGPGTGHSDRGEEANADDNGNDDRAQASSDDGAWSDSEDENSGGDSCSGDVDEESTTKRRRIA